jgi:hypothetical protein
MSYIQEPKRLSVSQGELIGVLATARLILDGFFDAPDFIGLKMTAVVTVVTIIPHTTYYASRS